MNSYLPLVLLVFSNFTLNSCFEEVGEVVNDTQPVDSDHFRYQITLWVSLFLIAILVAILWAFYNASTIRDPTLYTQLKSTTAEKKEH